MGKEVKEPKRFKPGPVDCMLVPWIADDGTPFISFATTTEQPCGIKIVGNGTLTHPLDVQLSGVYAAAPDLLAACKSALPYLRDHVCMTVNDGPGDRIALDKLEAAIAKAESEAGK